MKISKKRFEAMKRAKRGAKRAAGGLKANGLQVLAGAAVQFLEQKLVENFPTIASQGWWAPPVAMGAVALLAKRSARFRPMGDGLLGAAGYSFGLRYRSMTASAEAGRVIGLPFRPRVVPAQLPADASVPLEAGRVYRGARTR